jgi:hypothetical protein
MKGLGNGHLLLIFAFGLASPAMVEAETVLLGPKKDNSIYSESENSNGSGQYLFVGTTNVLSALRRALITFDVAAIPTGATIQSASLTLHVSREGPGNGIQIYLHRALSDWGEGASFGGRGEGSGGAATPGDATWHYNFFDTSTWSTTDGGGDFATHSSADVFVSGLGFSTWSSTPALVADVQSWLDSPQTNFGWLIRGELEGEAAGTAKRFDSRENSSAAFRPVLSVTYSPPVVDAGMDGGQLDAGNDAGQSDAGVDGGQSDSGEDGGQPDAGVDAGNDAGMNSGPPDSGPSDADNTNAGGSNDHSGQGMSGCQSAPGSFFAILGIALLGVRASAQSRRRRRMRARL